jgi:hypothetical protein
MEMNQSFNFFQATQPESHALALSSVGTIYTHPDDVLHDPRLTTAEKKTMLASWISDARAVENAPALRRLDSGAIVEVDAILRALTSLDAPSAAPKQTLRWTPPRRHERSRVSRWLRRAGRPDSANDNDDDPPPAPAGVSIPFRQTFVPPPGPWPEGLRGPLRATG